MMAALCYLSIDRSALPRLIYATDYEGDLCSAAQGPSSSKDLTSTRVLYYFNYTDVSSYKRCMQSCPDPSNSPLVCKYGITPADTEEYQDQQISDNLCVASVSTITIFNICVPKGKLKKDSALDRASFQSSSLIEASWQQVYSNLDVIGFACVASLAFSFVWFQLLRWFGQFMIIISFALVFLLSGGTTALLGYLYVISNSADWLEKTGLVLPVAIESYYQGLFLVGLAAMGCITIAIVAMAFAYRMQIKIAVAALEESSLFHIPYLEHFQRSTQL